MHVKENIDLVRGIECLDINIKCPFVVFMSPECAVTSPWRNIFCSSYGQANIVLVAIDEAHCIEDWSVDSLHLYCISV